MWGEKWSMRRNRSVPRSSQTQSSFFTRHLFASKTITDRARECLSQWLIVCSHPVNATVLEWKNLLLRIGARDVTRCRNWFAAALMAKKCGVKNGACAETGQCLDRLRPNLHFLPDIFLPPRRSLIALEDARTDGAHLAQRGRAATKLSETMAT
jgi:hypothetical protein